MVTNETNDAAVQVQHVETVIAQDQPLLCQALAALADEQGLRGGVAVNRITDLIRNVEARRPKLLMMEILFESRLCFDLLGKLRQTQQAMRILVVSRQPELLFAERSLKAGADGFVSTLSGTEEIRSAIRTVISGGTYLSTDVERMIVQRAVGRHAQTGNPLDSLTNRELDVFQLLGLGHTPRDIARKIELSVKTIETYRDRLKEKLGFHSSHDLMRHAFACHLLGYQVRQETFSSNKPSQG